MEPGRRSRYLHKVAGLQVEAGVSRWFCGRKLDGDLVAGWRGLGRHLVGEGCESKQKIEVRYMWHLRDANFPLINAAIPSCGGNGRHREGVSA